jgi:DEAD/DEAH box helicase domain-containing protein
MDARRVLDEFTRQPGYDGQIVYERFISPRSAQYDALKPPLPRVLTDSLRAQRITRLYTHQVEAITALRRHENVVVVTATASGKTLCYNLPVLESLLADPAARALYLFPTKALAQDQADALAEFGLPGVVVGTYDGDTPVRQRRAVRDEAHVILTNPDMLHLGILPQHHRWAGVFRHLRYVVIDDVHIYRGVFGSNVANILRRLRRVCRLHGADPVFICTSATIANPQEFAATLLGLPVTVVDADGSPSGPRWFALWNPPLIDQARAHRRSSYTEATALFTQLVRAGARTIVFTQARKITELIYRQARRALEDAPELAGRISAYRAGYLPEERHAIEQRLFNGELIGVVSTSALELGIDVGSLDAAILVGYPGTIASTWQRAGRAGRGREDALVVLVALEDALDQYLMRHPEYLFARPHEHAVIDPENPYILAAHLRCAASEVPVWRQDADIFGPRTEELAAILEGQGDLARRRDRWYWANPGYPAKDVEVRAASGDLFRIVDASRGRLVGTVDAARAFEQVHPGGVYLHQGETYVVEHLDAARRIASVRLRDVDYYTQPRTTTDLEILQPLLHRPWGGTTASFGQVVVTTQVIAFARKRLLGDEVLGEDPLDLPPQRLQTTGLWFPISDALVSQLQRRGGDLAGGIHAVEHAAIGMLPLFAMCDRWDLGGVSYPRYPALGAPAIFIYEAHPGGVGITEKGYELLDQLMTATLETIEACPCEAGCPSCIQSPKCGNMNEPLDKAAAMLLLKGLLGARSARPRGEGRARRPRRTRRHAPRPSTP